VTISLLAERAMINRQTFYKHYVDKYDLATQMSDAILQWYDQLGQERIALAKASLTLDEIINRLRPHLAQLLARYRRPMLALRTIHLPQLDLEQALKQRITQVVKTLLGTAPSLLEQTVMESVILGLLDYLLAYQQLPSSQEIQVSLSRLSKLFEASAGEK
jgi:AcrR family transcriptional regulator